MAHNYEPHADKERSTSFGRWLTERREAAGLKQQRLAMLLGNYLERDFHSGRISEWEQGQKLPTPDIVAALKALLDPGGEEPPQPQLAVAVPAMVDLQLTP